jgi:hypothetical protein
MTGMAGNIEQEISSNRENQRKTNDGRRSKTISAAARAQRLAA